MKDGTPDPGSRKPLFLLPSPERPPVHAEGLGALVRPEGDSVSQPEAIGAVGIAFSHGYARAPRQSNGAQSRGARFGDKAAPYGEDLGIFADRRLGRIMFSIHHGSSGTHPQLIHALPPGAIVFRPAGARGVLTKGSRVAAKIQGRPFQVVPRALRVGPPKLGDGCLETLPSGSLPRSHNRSSKSSSKKS